MGAMVPAGGKFLVTQEGGGVQCGRESSGALEKNLILDLHGPLLGGRKRWDAGEFKSWEKGIDREPAMSWNYQRGRSRAVASRVP